MNKRDCKNWKKQRCSLELFGGNPSAGVCQMCKDRKPKMKGAGDLVEAVTTATGVKYLVDKLSKKTGKDCGCGKRKEALNKAVPFGGSDELQRDEN